MEINISDLVSGSNLTSKLKIVSDFVCTKRRYFSILKGKRITKSMYKTLCKACGLYMRNTLAPLSKTIIVAKKLIL